MSRVAQRLWGVTGVLLLALVALGLAWRECVDGNSLDSKRGGVFEITPQESYWSITERLVAEGYAPNQWVVMGYTLLHPRFFKFRSGEYRVDAQERLADFIQRIHEGRVWLHPVTLVEGWSMTALRQSLNNQAFLDNDLAGVANEDLVAQLGIERDTPVPNAEGLFAAVTFSVAKHTKQSAILKQAYALNQKRLAQVWAARDRTIPLQTPYEALILASLIERETANAEERPLIASVFYNRLNRRMRLQTDPTVIYALADRYDGHLHHEDLAVDSPYNTYRHEGLPPGPIGLVGLASLQAALHPAASEYVYFVASGAGDGRHHFSTTLQEHQRAVKQYIDQTASKEHR